MTLHRDKARETKTESLEHKLKEKNVIQIKYKIMKQQWEPALEPLVEELQRKGEN